ncbi:aminopeptidase [Undibacterium amnicola]|uniref:Aminopeptidase n=1 Tax=Undibacterium amnicola TaxID=1834038 RepID=A0ABR6XKL0_9BURK|nr:C1 family peptidase [Undibacterium amnicola]MBC3830050.1 aminopeptidase [Undibacterium amnicola]
MKLKTNAILGALCCALSLASMTVLAQQATVATANAATPTASPKKTFTITHEAQRTAAKDQARTNTCWNFATASFMESEVARQGGKLIELSEVFGVRHAYPLKADAYLRVQGKATFWEGGNNHDAMDMLRRYGAVPKTNYSGLKEGETRLDHAELAATSKAFLDAVIKSGRPSKSWRAAFEGILDAYIGKPPANFIYEGKLHTPQTFRDQVLKLNPEDYVEVTSFNHHPFYQRMRLEIPDNWSHDNRFLNVPIDDMEKIMTNALSNGYTISWGGDTSEKGFNVKEGFAVLEDEVKEVTQNSRQEAFDDWRSTDDHSMHIVGLSKDDKGNAFFLTKNSYGTTSGPFEGHLHMSKNYVRMKTIYFMVHKQAIPEDIRRKAGIK